MMFGAHCATMNSISLSVHARALFAPLSRLGLIVIDEEHESSYKQDSEEWGAFTVFYDARTVAAQLARITESVLIYGSATPSLDVYATVQRKEMQLLRCHDGSRHFAAIRNHCSKLRMMSMLNCRQWKLSICARNSARAIAVF